jgi:hypothetical protein
VVTPVDSRGWIVNSQAQASPSPRQPVWSIELHTTASTVVIPMIRAVAADLAARASFEVDSSDDLRMALDDACAMLVHIAAEGARLSCRLTVWPERIEAVADVDVEDGAQPLPSGRLDGGCWSAWLRRLRPAPCLLNPVTVGACGSPLGKQTVTALPWD